MEAAPVTTPLLTFDDVQARLACGRTWLLAGGPCPLCAAASEILAGKVVPFSEPFIKAGTTIATTDGAVTFARDVFVPSEAHPNCRCISINELADEDDGN
jgi:hypothetical protein